MTMDGDDLATIRLPRPDYGFASLRDARDALEKLGAALTTNEQINAAAAVTDTSASEAQRETGNYRKGKVTFHGLRISIENPKGSTRSGVSKDGATWSRVMKAHYGYVSGTTGADGDAVDCFIGPDASSTTVYVVNQLDPRTRRFDEHKAMLGYASEADAEAGYLANYEKGWKGFGSIRVMSIGDFQKWILNGDNTKRADDGVPRSTPGQPGRPQPAAGDAGRVPAERPDGGPATPRGVGPVPGDGPGGDGHGPVPAFEFSDFANPERRILDGNITKRASGLDELPTTAAGPAGELTGGVRAGPVSASGDPAGYTFSDYADDSDPADPQHRFDVHHRGRNVGYAVTAPGNPADGPHHWVGGLSVKKRFRGQGLGRQLLQRVIDKYGDGDLRLRANPYKDKPLDADALVAFYRSMGFTETDDDKRMRRPGTKVAGVHGVDVRQARVDDDAEAGATVGGGPRG